MLDPEYRPVVHHSAVVDRMLLWGVGLAELGGRLSQVLLVYDVVERKRVGAVLYPTPGLCTRWRPPCL